MLESLDAMPDYLEFLETEDEAIAHCRKRNSGLNSKDPRCVAVVDGPGCGAEEHDADCQCCAYAVVDLETARELLDDGESVLPCLIVTG